VYSPFLNAEIREDSLLACYFFYGEETFLADQFVGQLRDMLAASLDDDFHVDRFYLDESKWMDIIDTARSVPFLFHAWRVLVVGIPERRAASEKGGGKRGEPEGEEGKGAKFLSEIDQKIIRGYFADPAARTTLVVIMPGRVRKNDSIVRFFSSLPRNSILVKEVKRLYVREVKSWADRKAQTLGKSLTEGAKARLYEIVGSDLRLLSNELEKLAIFVGDKRGIDEDDVNQATAWLRSYEAYEIDDVLTAADFEKGVAVLGHLFSEGEKPELIVGRLTTFFKNVLTAQSWLREKSKTRDEIFQDFFPYIQKVHSSLYDRKYDGFFAVVEGLSRAELGSILKKLQKADIKIKTTDSDERTVLEVFLKEYCLLRSRKKAISRG
jgi:DNA polymerase III delta subunit